MSPFAPWSVYKNRVSEGATLILTLGGVYLEAVSVGAWTHADSLAEKSGERTGIAVSDLTGNLLDAVRTGFEERTRSFQTKVLKIGQRCLIQHRAKASDKGSVADSKRIGKF